MNEELIVDILKRNRFVWNGNGYHKSYKSIVDYFSVSKHPKEIFINLNKTYIQYKIFKSSKNYIKIKFDFKEQTAFLDFSVSFIEYPNSLFTGSFLIDKFNTANKDHLFFVNVKHEYKLELLTYLKTYAGSPYQAQDFQVLVREAKEFVTNKVSKMFKTDNLDIFTVLSV